MNFWVANSLNPRITNLHTSKLMIIDGPPAVIASSSTAEYFTPFCTSVVLGSDIICRLNRTSIYALLQNITHLVNTCHEQKVNILGRAFLDWLNSCTCIGTCIGIGKSGCMHHIQIEDLNEIAAGGGDEEGIDERTPIALRTPSVEHGNRNAFEVRAEQNDESLLSGSSSHNFNDLHSTQKRASQQPQSPQPIIATPPTTRLRWKGFDTDPEMTLPGKIIHFVKQTSSVDTSATLLGRKGTSGSSKKENKKVYKAVWAHRDEFKQIVIGSSMLSDHLPNNMGVVLRRVIDGADSDGNLPAVSY